MRQLMRSTHVRWRPWLALLLGATLVAACSGGGSDAPAALPDQLVLRSAEGGDIADPIRFTSNLGPATGLSFNWDFGDAGSSQAAEPTHQYARPGDYEVQLRVSNSAGETRSARLQLSVNNRALVRGLQ